MIRTRTGALLLGIVAILPASGCGADRQRRWDQPPRGTVVVQVDSATAARNAAAQPGALATVQALPVTRWTGPGNRPFEIAQRSAAPEVGHARRFGSISSSFAASGRASPGTPTSIRPTRTPEACCTWTPRRT